MVVGGAVGVGAVQEEDQVVAAVLGASRENRRAALDGAPYGAGVIRVHEETGRREDAVGTGGHDAGVAEALGFAHGREAAGGEDEGLWRRNLEDVGRAPGVEEGGFAGEAVDAAVAVVGGEREAGGFGEEAALGPGGSAGGGAVGGCGKDGGRGRGAFGEEIGAAPAAGGGVIPSAEGGGRRVVESVPVAGIDVGAAAAAGVEVGGGEEVGDAEVGGGEAGEGRHVVDAG